MTTKNLQPTTYNLQPSPRNLQPNSGFVMLFSVLVSSLLVAIGLSIFNLTLKEITLSTAGRESQIAFYAANSGMECALYWHLTQNAFAISNTNSEITRIKNLTPQPTCNRSDVNDVVIGDSNSATTKFEFYIFGSSGSCANVSVKNERNGTQIETTIESQGKNICGATGRRVERGLKASIITNM